MFISYLMFCIYCLSVLCHNFNKAIILLFSAFDLKLLLITRNNSKMKSVNFTNHCHIVIVILNKKNFYFFLRTLHMQFIHIVSERDNF